MLYDNFPNTKRTMLAVLALLLAGQGSAFAQDAAQGPEATPAFSLSANVMLVSEYRFRGVSLSDKDVAIQGGFDIETATGFYAGTWASSIESFAGSETEVDLYAGYGGDFEISGGDLAYDVGVMAYTYPGSSGTLYLEGYGSLSGALENIEWTAGAAYAFSQDNLGNQDNIYLYLDGGMPLGESGLSLAGHFAYEDGAFGDGKLDWSLGISMPVKDFTLGVSYVDTNLSDRLGDAGILISLGARF
ncbi:MAG: hypothetical protein IID51_13330 [Proteobacteria bacterium]|nr:hypothetical protein [Pseudomonadota bacterium]